MRAEKSIVPAFEFNNIENGLVIDAIFFSKFQRRFCAVFISVSYFINLHLSEFFSSFVLSDFVYWKTSFLYAIVNIFLLSSWEKMVGIYARGIIAFMENVKSWWDLFNKKIKRKSVCSPVFPCAIRAMSTSKGSVPTRTFAASPNPTFIRFVYIFKKSLNNFFHGYLALYIRNYT